MQRDPNQYYTHAGKLYGPPLPAGSRASVAGSISELDQLSPAKAEVMEEGPLRLDLTRGATAIEGEESSAKKAKGK